MRKIVQKVAVVTIICVIVFALNFSVLAAPAVALRNCPKVYPVCPPCPTRPKFPGGQKLEKFPVGIKPISPGYQPLPSSFPYGAGYARPFPFPYGAGYARPFPFPLGAGYARPFPPTTGIQGAQKPQTKATNTLTPFPTKTGTPGGQKSQTETISNPTPSPSTTDDESG